jgi:hypothetical protein
VERESDLMRKILSFVFAAILSAGLAGQASADLILTGVADATLTGGTPKILEFFATDNIPDLSI